MSFGQLLGLAISLIAIAVGLWIPSYWRGSGSGRVDDAEMPAWYPWGDTIWRGSVRAIALAPLIGVLGATAICIQLATGDEDDGVAALLIVLAAGALLIVFPSIVLFNRPKWLVPPRMRGDSGAVARWRERAPRNE